MDRSNLNYNTGINSSNKNSVRDQINGIHNSVANNKILATAFDSGFPLSHDTYNGIYAASDGNIYYVLCSESISEGGKMYCFSPTTNEITLCGELTEICGEKGMKAVPQGKSHVVFIEKDKKLFFATHLGYYFNDNGMDKKGLPPEGYKEYPGGHLLSYDLETKEFTDLCTAPQKEGVLTMNMDIDRQLMYGITWPNGHFFRYDINENKLTDFGPISMKGENGTGATFRVLCRSIAINALNGSVYFSIAEGKIYRCNPGATMLEEVTEDDLQKDYFGSYEPSTPGSMAYNWRQIFWYGPHECFYGLHGNSGYLFRFNADNHKIELIERLTSLPSKKSGMFDQFTYGYLGFALGPDQRTIYYLTGAPMYENEVRVVGKSSSAKGEAKGMEHLHLVTYDLIEHKYTDFGPIFFANGESPLYVNSITIGLDGRIYFMGRIIENGATRSDLISIPKPLAS